MQDFKYFYFIFRADNFAKIDKASEEAQTTIHYTLAQNENAKIELENDLQSIIYGIEGKDSLFEFIGSAIFDANPQASLQEVYENSLYFIFRMLFIAYFEDKFSETLGRHLCFGDILSVTNLYNQLDNFKADFVGNGNLNQIFRIYDKGEPNYDMPVFNGGLFDESKAPLLLTPRTFDNQKLKHILKELLFYNNGDSLFKRDYKTLSVAHLGTIYEGLLSYFFELADENLVYVIYSDKKASKDASKNLAKNQIKSMEGYFDIYDYKNLEKSYKIERVQNYQKGQIYLKNTSNSRKSTASFYTPDIITKFLVENALENVLNDENITHFKILDNACGSGHFLVESLNQITQIVSQNFDSFPSLKKLFLIEKQSIESNVSKYIKDYVPDENDILKRLLLKCVIFGVDLNPFSIELTKLSLWIDSFIFGTPLSFIEHHIKQGNALIGTSIAEFRQYFEAILKKDSSLFVNNFLDIFGEFSDVFTLLDSITDTTHEDVLESKRIYSEQIKPKLDDLNMYLNFITTKSFCDAQELQILKSGEVSINEILNKEKYKDLQEIISKYTKRFNFFNYEIEFPEITAGSNFVGFQAVVGNPPWDKTKFSDSDFFPQYRSNYRTMSNSQKAELKTNLLAKPYIAKNYSEQKEFIQSANNYYKASYPLNEGSGDGNLFRFFVERNLALLAPNASLNYVLPSALMLEEGSFRIRKEILENKNLVYFYSFENREGIFRDVDSRYKFALMQVINAPRNPRSKIKTMFYKTNPAQDLYDKDSIIKTSFKSIKAISPHQLAFMEVRSRFDLEILEKCYKAYDALDLEWLDFRRELDMTNDKDLFIESFGENLLPLYEGKMIHQFDAKFGTPQYFLDKKAFDERLRSKEIYRMKQDLGLDSKEFDKLLDSIISSQANSLSLRGSGASEAIQKSNSYCERSEAIHTKDSLLDSIIAYDREFFRLGFRAIASDTNERTLIFSLLPKDCGVGNSIWSNTTKIYVINNSKISTKTIGNLKLLFALGMFNSIMLDFIARAMIQINVNKTYLERIPLPQPSDEEILANPLYKELALNALKLQLYNDKAGNFKELADEFKISKNQIPSTQKLYDTLKAKNDILIAKEIYKLEKSEFIYMLTTFKVLNTKQPGFIALLESLWEE
ncbi:restriction endonuclease [Helicobacter sp. CLO-3]|uniref:Eco57I restriction-modification methylase domain-containing protein n=1 Tax=unclassified Helicobacter TaxID=2593540 RepID=UPI0008056A6A|nr:MULTISPECIES: N-6 DNA methylase [unclassified Helicobacter]OBV29823.1 restriction endonuclease [Helicobacter sp. CLO-3]OHU83973.1 restriction endonuclease [Helicobacter sp. CLO-3]